MQHPSYPIALSLLEGYQPGHHIKDPHGRYELLVHGNTEAILITDDHAIDLREILSAIDFSLLGFLNSTLLINLPGKPKAIPPARENEAISLHEWIKYTDFSLEGECPKDPQIRPIGKAQFDIEPAHSLIATFWSDYDTFDKNGIGYYYDVDGEVAAIAASCFRSREYTEMQVFTLPPYRRRGISYTLTRYCLHQMLRQGLTPRWTTGKNNTASQGLARKLGYSQPVDHFVLEYTRHPREIPFEPEEDDKNLGHYRYPLGDVSEIVKEDGKYYSIWNKKTKMRLYKMDKDMYFVKEVDARFLVDGDKAVLHQHNTRVPVTKITDGTE